MHTCYSEVTVCRKGLDGINPWLQPALETVLGFSFKMKGSSHFASSQMFLPALALIVRWTECKAALNIAHVLSGTFLVQKETSVLLITDKTKDRAASDGSKPGACLHICKHRKCVSMMQVIFFLSVSCVLSLYALMRPFCMQTNASLLLHW